MSTKDQEGEMTDSVLWVLSSGVGDSDSLEVDNVDARLMDSVQSLNQTPYVFTITKFRLTHPP